MSLKTIDGKDVELFGKGSRKSDGSVAFLMGYIIDDGSKDLCIWHPNGEHVSGDANKNLALD